MATAPLDAVIVMAREIATRERQLQEHMRTHPSHTVVASAWADAMRQAAQSLSRDLAPSHA